MNVPDGLSSDAYHAGWNHGLGIAQHNVPTIGAMIWTESFGNIVVDADNIAEVHADLCYSAEMNSRQFSPFESIAREFNDSDDSALLWDSFDAGVFDAIAADLATYNYSQQ